MLFVPRSAAHSKLPDVESYNIFYKREEVRAFLKKTDFADTSIFICTTFGGKLKRVQCALKMSVVLHSTHKRSTNKTSLIKNHV